MKLLHTADWHLGRQLHGRSLLEDQRHVLDQLVTIVREDAVDGVLVAGDLFDRAVPPAAAIGLLDEVLSQLCLDLQVPVVMISGNHDSADRLAFGARHLARSGLHLVTRLADDLAPLEIECGGQRLICHAIPYLEPAQVRQQFGVDVRSHDAALGYLLQTMREQATGQGAPRVVLAHAFLAGGEVSESERPLCIGGAEWVSPGHFAGFDYVALGHLHGRQQRAEPQIRYAGSPLKYSFSEVQHHKSVTLVELDETGLQSITERSLEPLHDLRIIEGELNQLLAAAAADPAPQDYLLVRLTDRGALLDAMGQLRQVYPNVLHLERPGLMASGERAAPARDQLQRGELAMVEAFFQQMRGEALDEPSRALVADLLTRLHRRGDEV